MEISVIELEDMESVISLADGCWGHYYTDFGEAYARTMAECLVRDAWADRELALKICDGGELLGVAIASPAGVTAETERWAAERMAAMSVEEREWFCRLLDYMKEADAKTFAMMDADDAKMSLFISVRRGCGRLLLRAMMHRLRGRGIKNLSLWTDDSCTHDYYPSHGFRLVASYADSRYSTPREPFRTYIYCKGSDE